MSLNEFKTPGIDPIFDLYVAYGYVEALVRAGAEEIVLKPLGISYSIQTNAQAEELYRGLADALSEMLALHYATGRTVSSKEGTRFVSNIDFSGGANINNQYYDKVPQRLEKVMKEIFNTSKKSWKLSEKVPISLTLMPSAGKYVLKHFGSQSGNPIKIDLLNHAFAWIGFHYYTPYIQYKKGNITWVHIYQIAPTEDAGLIPLLTLKDLKMHLPHYYEERLDFLTNRRLALLYHLLHSESLGALEVLTERQFVIRSYTLEKAGNNQAVRSFGEEEVGKLMNFLWRLKRADFYHAVRFIDRLLREVTGADSSCPDRSKQGNCCFSGGLHP